MGPASQLRSATCLALALVGLAAWHNWRNPALKPAAIRPTPRVETRDPLGKSPLAFEINDGQSFEFDFVVAPGADSGRIVLAFEGIDGLDLDSQGDLRVRAGGSEVRQRRPRVYQVKGGTRSELAGAYTVEPPNRVRFALGA